MRQVQALRWYAAGELRLEEIAEPEDPAPGQAVVEVAYCGICGTDLHEYVSGPHLIRPAPHPLTGQAPPLALGHEISGTVAAVGPGPQPVPVGTRVTVDPCWRCGACRSCREGEYHLCDLGGSVGLASPGGFAQFVVVPSAGLAPIPDGVSLEMAALGEPLAVGLHAVRRGEVTPGDTVAIIGGGPIGAAAVLEARAAGATQVVVVEPNEHRRGLASTFGATAVVDPAEEVVHRAIRALTGGEGADVTIEASGVATAMDTALRSTRRRGSVVVAALGAGGYAIDPRQLVLFERRILGTLGYNHDIPRVLAQLAVGQIVPGPMISGVRPLAAGREVFAGLAADGRREFKVLLTPGAR